jgi:hypothetical protein
MFPNIPATPTPIKIKVQPENAKSAILHTKIIASNFLKDMRNSPYTRWDNYTNEVEICQSVGDRVAFVDIKMPSFYRGHF